MLVVSNTSPICNLAIIGKLDFLRRRYGIVKISPVVADELSALSHRSASLQIAASRADGWLAVEKPASTCSQLTCSLDPGETEAIALALALKADVLLIDEKRGREAARAAGLSVGGVLGELLYARNAGWIPTLRAEINRLRAEAGFFIDRNIEQFILSQAGE
jgi:uncharacterized protein